MKAEIADGYCATSTEHEGVYYAGSCPFIHIENNTDRLFSELPSDPDLLNDTMCGPYNRKGLLCGRCIDGYGPAVYSLDMKCANCSKLSTGYAISVYLLLEFIPITLFYMGIVIFLLNITAGPLGYVIFCQVYVYAAQNHLSIINVHSITRICASSSTVLLFTHTVWFMESAIFLICDPPFALAKN